MGMETKAIQLGTDFIIPKARTSGPGVNAAIIDRLLETPGSAEFLPIPDSKDMPFSTDEKSKWQGRAKSIRGILSKAAQARHAQVHSALVIKGVAGGKQVPTLSGRDYGVLAYGVEKLTLKPGTTDIYVNSEGVQIYGVRKNKKASTTETPANTPAPTTGSKASTTETPANTPAPTTGSKKR